MGGMTAWVGWMLVPWCLSAARVDEPGRRAVAYLAAEVPRWSRENGCYSCHNNGDAARALYHARGAGVAVDRSALRDTTAWLGRPEGWDANGGDGPTNDKGLARLQFALALAAAVESGRDDLRPALRRAAVRLASDRSVDGSWPVGDVGIVGSPATYGRRLASALAARVLRDDGNPSHTATLRKAEEWVRAGPIGNVVAAAAVLLVEPTRGGPADRSEAARRATAYLIAARSGTGGWGPFPDSPTEAFDTALALIALAPFRDDPGVALALRPGRAALVRMQLSDGSWPETTRPPGGESYAQRLSTAGWATHALLATSADRGPSPAR